MKRAAAYLAAAACLTGLLTGCGGGAAVSGENDDPLSGLTPAGSMELSYAEQFTVDTFEGGLSLITIGGEDRYLVVPEGQQAPQTGADITVLQQPLDSIYLVATSAMDFFVSLDALDTISLSGTRADGWYLDAAREAMTDGDIEYAGKYSAPDYEAICDADCDLALESTMIYHTPKVKEQLERLGIPVLVERSSYESNPLGRMEWIKFYGALTGKEEQASAAFDEQKAAMEAAAGGSEEAASGDGADVDPARRAEGGRVPEEGRKKTVAYFYITAAGMVNVRKSSDYVPKLIEQAGGEYIFKDLGTGESRSSSVNMQLEEFYSSVKDADFLIYKGPRRVRVVVGLAGHRQHGPGVDVHHDADAALGHMMLRHSGGQCTFEPVLNVRVNGQRQRAAGHGVHQRLVVRRHIVAPGVLGGQDAPVLPGQFVVVTQLQPPQAGVVHVGKA